MNEAIPDGSNQGSDELEEFIGEELAEAERSFSDMKKTIEPFTSEEKKDKLSTSSNRSVWIESDNLSY